ncbi:MAG: ABC transporter ATP-binding protein [Rhodothermales bacterium]|jgi:ABC-type multidrug transport system fused ATPase/permease subunit|nr:ABC transporter ATP-binding protein [Rhodothermales bacterium]MDG2016717.1 ABC transporter ATP-binding protein [Rhodothermales bacterium]
MSAASKSEKKPKKMSATWREARQLMWTHRKKLAFGFFLMVINRLSGFVLPYGSKYLIDTVLAENQLDMLWPLALAVGGATILGAITNFSLSQIISVTAQAAIMDMRRRVQAHVTRLPVSYFDGTKSGVLISRIMTDAEGIRNLVGTGIVQLVGGLFTATIALIALFYINWVLTSATLGFLLLFGVGMAAAFKRLRPLFRERGEINSQVTGRLNETLNGIRIVKAYGVEAREQSVFAMGVDELFQNVKKSITGVAAISTFAGIVIGVVGILMITVGGNSIASGTMTMGDFVMYIFLVGLLAAPIVQMASIGTQVSEAFAGLDRIRELMDMETEDEEDERKATLLNVNGDIRLENVHFSYEEDVPVLRGVSLNAPAGSTTALVGSSGSGKSTLVSLVMAFNRPDSGHLLIDGQNIDEVKLTDFRSHLGVVMQENFLFDGTVADNIRFARPDASPEEVERVAKLAHCHLFISDFPDKYDTVVGERGVKLSGGQRQRIAIARAILADPRILILDEATSSLDSESEALIQAGFASLRKGRTTFVIAHRLSTIRSADQIVVLEEGEVVECGTHAELMLQEGRYKDLHDQQYAWEENLFVNPGEDYTPPNT